ncbi:hypothetical protein, partial [Sutterella wadsworthensis]|uniref:hypothetical protein n=1 Tax=Sutterella wadsworthensis TaxID=40545 RepID=UPI00242C0262
SIPSLATKDFSGFVLTQSQALMPASLIKQLADIFYVHSPNSRGCTESQNTSGGKGKPKRVKRSRIFFGISFVFQALRIWGLRNHPLRQTTVDASAKRACSLQDAQP